LKRGPPSVTCSAQRAIEIHPMASGRRAELRCNIADPSRVVSRPMGNAWKWLVRELRAAIPIIAFFLVAFNMIVVTQAAILGEYHLTAKHHSIATVGAVIVGKAILIVDNLAIARWFSRRLIYNLLWKTVLFWLVALAFRILEELIPLLFHGDSLGETAHQLLAKTSWPRFFIIEMWLLSLLFLYCSVVALARRIGPDRVKRMLLEPANSDLNSD